MQRLLSKQSSVTHFLRPNTPRLLITQRFASSDNPGKKASSTPGWEGRSSKEHTVRNNDELDVQSKASHSGMKEREQGNSSSSAINSQDDTNSKQKAKEEHPEAPTLIGMEDERE